MGATLWAVVSGYYECSTVQALFSTRELAEAHFKACRFTKYDYASIEEYVVSDRPPVKVVWYDTFVRMNDDGSYPPLKPYINKHTTWDYAMPRGLTDEPSTDLLYSKPYIYTPRNYLGPAFGYSEPTGPPEHHPGQYGFEARGLNRANVKKAAAEVMKRWSANGFRLDGARPWK